MNHEFIITQKEKKYLRELAKKQLEYANLPIMEERRKLWYAHNSLKGDRPPIVMETFGFDNDIFPAPECETPGAIEIERTLLRPIINHELIDDDKVISPCYTVFWKKEFKEFDIEKEYVYAQDSKGNSLGYQLKHLIDDIKNDLPLLRHSAFKVNRDATIEWKNIVEEIIGDILPVEVKNGGLGFYFTPSRKVVELTGLENMMYFIIDYPDEIHTLYRFICDDMINYIKWQEKEGLLTLNNENDFVGAGSYGFTTELPTENFKQTGIVTAKDLWVNLNSQETVGISPDMFGEFIFPHYYELAQEFGLTYYGCCEQVHSIWQDYISKLPGLRKVSISPWCDEDFMGSALMDSKIIYSRKPSPNYIGVEGCFDENAFSGHIIKTLKAAKGCHLEFIFRDTYTLSGDLSKPGRAVKITRDLVGEMW